MRRRSLVCGLTAIISTGTAAFGEDDPFYSQLFGKGGVPTRKQRQKRPSWTSREYGIRPEREYEGMQQVAFRSSEKPGTIIIKTKERALYYVLEGGQALKYGIAVGKAGYSWSGVAHVGYKVEWPNWTPPEEMIERRPELAEYAEGMPGGPDNPLGARALYLYQGNRDTLYRIHGTNEPWSIGTAASSGCIRMLNEEVIDLYDRVRIGARVIVI
jgi:lipoprotein-anchoring transpeptidase ErfK/SrfK